MRWIFTSAVFILLLPEFAQPNGAEKLYRGMEKIIRDAKSLKMGFEIGVDLDKETSKMRGAVSVAQGNKARLEVTATAGGKERAMTVIADGKQAVVVETDTPKAEPKPVESNFSQTRPQILARGGVFATIEIGPSTENFDIDKVMAISDFKLGKKEKIGVRETQAVECTLKPDNGQVAQMTVWLDTQSNLPLKRVVTVAGEKGVFRVTEVYTEITINPKFDSKLFELPK